MKYEVQLTAKAERDVDQILSWFAGRQSTTAGTRWFSQLMERIDSLENHPERCRFAAEAEELGIEIREILLGRRLGIYRILFVINQKVVEVLHIRHGARDSISNLDIS